jgi:hypothetical protein
MKVEYLADGSDDCPLVRLYSFTTAEAGRLHDTFSSLASGSLQSVHLADVLTVEPIDDCRITFVRGERDRGVVPTGEHAFAVELSPSGWDQTAELAKPFREGNVSCHQWLTSAGEIQLLLSPTGGW